MIHRLPHARAVHVRTAVVALAAAIAFALVGTGNAAPGDVGYEGRSYTGTGTPTGIKRAESVLWWNDGFWWASMWDTTSQDFHIFRLDTSTQTWIDTGVAIDTRANTHADALWDGTKLYVASHLFPSDESPAVSGFPSRLYRFSYDAASDTYSLDAGFPALINNYRTETLVIDKDSTGKLWATWQQDNKIHVNRTVGSDSSWGTPFVLPVTAADNLTVDDNSSVIAFDGNKVGVMWSNQGASNYGMWFAVHVEGAPDTTWEASRTALQGQNNADDHMNLKALTSDGSGRVYAAVKTSHTSSSAPLIMLLVRDANTGDWESHVFGRASECHNRAIVQIDEEARVLHMFATGPASPNYTCQTAGGAIYEKTSPLDSISFPTGYGTVVMQDADSDRLHNVSSTKQNVNGTTGLALLAVNGQTVRYWHHYDPLGGPPPPPPAAPIADFSAPVTSGVAPLAVSFTDLSSNGPTSWSWDFGDGQTSTLKSPTHTYEAGGTYTVTLTATNAAGSDAETKVGYVTVDVPPPAAPVADFSASVTNGIAPLDVSFTDLSSNGPTSWSWEFGDGQTSTLQNPTHTYAAAGTYSVSLTATNSAGSDAEVKVGYVTVEPAPPDFALSASPLSRSIVRGDSTTYTVTVTPVNGFAGVVTLSVSGLPAGATADFVPNPLTVPPSASSTLVVNTTSTAKQGGHVLTITGTSGTLVRTTTITLHLKRK
jgi:PKD repeat protein